MIRIATVSLVVATCVATATTFLLHAQTAPTAPAAQAPSAPMPARGVPADLFDVAWMRQVQDAQIKTAATMSPFHNFQFVDRIAESGITFKHGIVDDAGRAYKAVHYDHGNGLAAADVNGDGLLDLYFVNQVGASQLWKNVGAGKFEDITATAGVGVANKIGVSASFADIDNDGDADLYVTTVRGGNVLFENDGTGKFRDISVGSGLNYVGHSSSAVFFDYNRDGRLDLFLVNVGRYTSNVRATTGARNYVGLADAFSGHLKPERAEPSILYRNNGGNKFTDVSRAMGLVDTSWSGDASIVDGNDDGWPDLYVLNMQGDDQYYENVGGKRFARKSRQLFPRTSWGAMGIKVFDVNNDSKLDIFITDMHSDMSATIGPEHEHMKSTIMWDESFRGSGKTSIWGNSLFLKDGPDTYRESSDTMGIENYCPWGPSIADLNADGFEDAFIASGMNYPFRYMVNSVKLNDGGRRFVDAEFILGVEPRRTGIAMPWFELDAAGRDKGHPDAAGANGKLMIFGARGTRSSVIFDIDGDGDLDIVTNEFNSVPMVLTSNLSERAQVRSLTVKLVGSRSNRDALGAIVKVTAGGQTYTKVLDGNSGYLSHSRMPLYFGLGPAASVDQVEVSWPSGAKQTVTSGLSINTTVEIKEP